MRKSFTAFMRKEVIHILRDPRTLLIALLIPIVEMLLFGFAISMDVNEVELMAAAPRMTPAIESEMSRLAHNPSVSFKGFIPTSEVEDRLRSGCALAVVVFDADYDANGLSQVVVDGSDPVVAQTAAGYVSGILNGGDGGRMPGVTILYNPRLRSAYNFVPGIMGLIFILICAMLTSVSIVREKETGTMEVLLVSPIRPVMIVIAKMIPYFLLACADLALILLLAATALDVPLSGSMSALILVSMVYIILSLALGLFISTITRTQMEALLISGMMLIIPVVMLSGMMFPIENMPLPLQYLSSVVPARWYIPAMREIMIEGLGFSHILPELGILTAMAVFLVIVAIKRFKTRLE